MASTESLAILINLDLLAPELRHVLVGFLAVQEDITTCQQMASSPTFGLSTTPSSP